MGRADVWVFDAQNAGEDQSLGGTPTTILTFFAEMPRALAVTPDGSKVYVAAFHSGNATASTFAAIFERLANPLPPFAPSSQLPLNVNVNAFGEEQPPTGLIVKYDGTHWRASSTMIPSRPTRPARAWSAAAVPRVWPWTRARRVCMC